MVPQAALRQAATRQAALREQRPREVTLPGATLEAGFASERQRKCSKACLRRRDSRAGWTPKQANP